MNVKSMLARDGQTDSPGMLVARSISVTVFPVRGEPVLGVVPIEAVPVVNWLPFTVKLTRPVTLIGLPPRPMWFAPPVVNGTVYSLIGARSAPCRDFLEGFHRVFALGSLADRSFVAG